MVLSEVRDPEALLEADWGPADAESAAVWLAGRVRARTPRGAAEFLSSTRSDYAVRVRASLRILSLYEQLFPGQYARSTRPPYSTERETEFYHLVRDYKFPVDLRPCYTYENWTYLWIPIRSQLQYDFILGHGRPFEQWGPSFQLVIALCNSFLGRDDWWPRLARIHGLPESPRPRPWERVSIGRFTDLCLEDVTLRMLPVAFMVASYKTGNLFIDAHPLNPTYKYLNARWEWNAENVEQLADHWRKGKHLLTQLAALDAWLAQAPAERMGRAVELWNKSGGEWEF